MIEFKIKVVDFTEENKQDAVDAIKEAFHKALKGSPAYANSEILLYDGNFADKGNDCDFGLVVGNSNDNNIALNISVSAIQTRLQ